MESPDKSATLAAIRHQSRQAIETRASTALRCSLMLMFPGPRPERTMKCQIKLNVMILLTRSQYYLHIKLADMSSSAECLFSQPE